MQEQNIPDGYMKNAQGHLVPLGMVKDYDKAKHDLVYELAGDAKGLLDAMQRFKGKVMGDIEAFVDLAMEKYEAKLGGDKGNVTLVSFDGRYKIVRSVAEHLVFDERLQAAKALIDECFTEWTDGGRPEVKSVINDAFQVDKEGRINAGRILGLRKLNITDPRWQRAMTAISDSLQVVGSKSYFRIYERGADGKYTQIPLDMAAL